MRVIVCTVSAPLKLASSSFRRSGPVCSIVVRRVRHDIRAEENKFAVTGKCRLLIQPQCADDRPCQAVTFQNMDLGLELFIETETTASEARGDVTHIQSIGTLGVDRQVSDRLHIGGSSRAQYNTAQKKHHDDRSER